MGQFLDLFVRFSHVFFISNCCNADPKDVQETLELCRPKEELRKSDATQTDVQEERIQEDVHEESVSSSHESIKQEKKDLVEDEDVMYDVEF